MMDDKVKNSILAEAGVTRVTSSRLGKLTLIWDLELS